MRATIIYRVLIVIAVMFVCINNISAQQLPERGLVRKGNEQFERRNFYNSLNRYNEALEHAPHSYEAQYNRANAYMQLMMANPQDSTLTADVSNKYFEQIANNKSLSAEQRGEVLRNLGESLFLQKEYESSLNAFRESLKLNPDDTETKRNYVLTKRIVDQKRKMQQQQQQQQNQNQDQNNNQQNQNQDQNNNQQNQDQQQNDSNKDNNNNQQDQQQNQQDQQQNQQDQQQDENKDGKEQPNEGEQPKPEGLNREQERMLDMIQGEEDKTQDKIKDAKQGTVVYGKKNW